MAKAHTNSYLIKQSILRRVNSSSSLTCAGLWGTISGLLFLLVVSVSIHFLDIKCWAFSSESPSVYVLQPTWNFLTLALAYLLWYSTETILTSNSDLCSDFCIHGTHISPLPLLIYLQVMASWQTSPAAFPPLLCWFLISVGQLLLPMKTQFTKLGSKSFLYPFRNQPYTLK